MSLNSERQSNIDVVLCGGTFKNGETYFPTTFEHSDEFGMLGGAVRVTAALTRVLEERSARITFAGGKSRKGDALRGGSDVPAPPAALVYKEAFLRELEAASHELQEQGLAIPKAPEIFLDTSTPNTNANLVNALQRADREGWTKITIISNRYHLARVEAICNIVREKLCLEHIHPEYIVAEDVVTAGYPGKYDQEIELAYTSEAGQLRLASEARGLVDIREGRYRFSEVRSDELDPVTEPVVID